MSSGPHRQPRQSTRLIAECASNHGGDLQLAKRFVKTFAVADYVKFQTYCAEDLSPRDTQYAWLAQAELSDQAHTILLETCQIAGTQFLTTLLSPKRLGLLKTLRLPAVKIGSAEAHDTEFVKRIVDTFPTVFISACLLCEAEIEHVQTIAPKAVLLGGITSYPAQEYHTPNWRPGWGWTDHTVGIDHAKLMVQLGVPVVEKHVKIEGIGRGNHWDATPAEFNCLVDARDRPDRTWRAEAVKKYRGRWRHYGRYA